MSIQSLFQRSFLALGLSIVVVNTAQAKGSEMFVCTSPDGVRTYQNSNRGEGCVPLNLNPITVVPTNKPTAQPLNGQGFAGEDADRPFRPRATFDDRTSGDFNAKDDRMKILQEELRIEESKLQSLKDEYKNGQPDRLGSERNNQKYLDRIARLEQDIMVTNDNIAILKAELSRLSR